jgi:ABC-type bacteriocin/lantibiotic exporter with double-glycine peptidase domain
MTAQRVDAINSGSIKSPLKPWQNAQWIQKYKDFRTEITSKCENPVVSEELTRVSEATQISDSASRHSAKFTLSLYALIHSLDKELLNSDVHLLFRSPQITPARLAQYLESWGFLVQRVELTERSVIDESLRYLLVQDGKIYLFQGQENAHLVFFEIDTGVFAIDRKSLSKGKSAHLYEISPRLGAFFDSAPAQTITEKQDLYGEKFLKFFVKNSPTEKRNYVISKFFLVVLTMLIPTSIYRVMNENLGRKDFSTFGYLVVALGVFLLFQIYAVYLNVYSQNQYLYKFKKNMLGYFSRTMMTHQPQGVRSGSIFSRYPLMEAAFSSVKYKALDLPVYSMLLLVFLVYTWQIDFFAFLILALSFVGAGGLVYFLRQKGGFSQLNTVKLKQTLYEQFHDLQKNLPVVTLHKQLGRYEELLNREARSLQKGNADYSIGLLNIQFLGTLLFKLATVAVLYFVLLEVLRSQAQAAQVFGITLILSYLATPFQSLLHYLIQLNPKGLLNMPVQTFKNELLKPERPSAEFRMKDYILFDKVSFRHHPQHMPAIIDASFKIKKGEVISIAGRAQSGKSTLAQLIAGLHDGYGGRILFDDNDLRHLDQEGLRQQVGFVAQEPSLYNESLLFNITPRTIDVPMNEVIVMSKAFGLHQLVQKKLGGQYGSAVSNDNQRFSYSERVLMSLVKNFLSPAQVIVFDDIFVHFDVVGARRLFEAIMRLKGERTYIFVTSNYLVHRSSDKILVLKGGRLVEEGEPKKLLHQNGEYSEFYRLQIGEQ